MNYLKSWYAITHIKEIKNKPTKLERFGKNLVAWRSNSEIIVMENRCPHRGAELSLGKVCDNAIKCPFHGFEFDTTGRCRYTPETQSSIPKLKAKTYPTKIVADMLWINIFGEDLDNSYAFEFIESLHNEFKGKYSIFTDTWNNNIRHCIENQLDYTHLATVHKKSIGRGYKIPQNVDLKVTNNYLAAYKDNKLMLKYILPNLWMLNNADSLKITVYFVPINENKTKLYLINYRKFLISKPIKPLADLVFSITNKIILNEDKRVVKTQKFDEDYNTKDFLLRHDQIIKEFRKIWDIQD
ncbi:aromatic ring-hydroxylating oxygenase subunit alpha [Francisella adeliensis]|uniref:Aromatic ring-hydroxylating dioxygenase subunit alpha n=1 Tax=Francisella adeliensis TaxID=2007306 RepID=A0A2Z4XXT9_9GAMM|nr:aromatic ring-hydroxylating dioxygenase subunit alpha [Francisella adeliensis]AXA33550.1 Rieske (2Fe-2S) protein [Francisella adeliensis]MBK2084745.1 aromatic ring-hydroxylating dioxygenase subunit alpha [Francisella adeliensis]MBK2097312.1 aromatic ring-hydroxylating dioxygenase subunit alpha [Francisella adeliensis]QIW11782.1 aromatic ring-hydroxylating dioxygenase subunit alpha [Francisella adeliensis]QIW13658.1 aromatic ring-hydroxylating dioxygenase subunit alpha [Francisella adeliensi